MVMGNQEGGANVIRQDRVHSSCFGIESFVHPDIQERYIYRIIKEGGFV